VEKHITLDRNMKGTDQKGSLGTEGIWRMVRDIRNLEKSMGDHAIYVSDAVEAARVKLERSVASKRKIGKGDLIREEDLHMLSPGDGYKWDERGVLIGKEAAEDIPADEIIYQHMII